MDDIYFGKNRRNKKTARQYDLPPVNNDGFEDISSYSEQNQPNVEIPNIGNRQKNDITFAVSHNNSKDESFAPYRANKVKKQKRTIDEPPVTFGKQKKDKTSKRNRRFFRFVAKTVVACFVISFVITFFAITFSGYTKTKLTGNDYVSSAQLKSSPLVRNILLIGVDGTEDSSFLRSDSMILVSVDNQHCKIKLSSFMRDSWLDIPDYKYAKLNAACSHGGPQLVVDTIEYNFGVDIDDYMLVNFTMFTDIIDEIGGIDIEVTQKEANFINKTTRHTVESGKNVHLNGAQALVYCRIRKLDSDYMRTYRQRKVIKALIAQGKTAGIQNLFAALVHVMPKIETNMGAFKLTCLVYRGGFAALLFPIRSTRIPTDNYSWSGWKDAQSVVELDIEKNADYLQNFIYTNTVASEEETE